MTNQPSALGIETAPDLRRPLPAEVLAPNLPEVVPCSIPRADASAGGDEQSQAEAIKAQSPVHGRVKSRPSPPVRKIRMIAGIGPTTAGGDAIRKLMQAGVGVFRLDLACVGRPAALQAVYAIRSLSTALQRPVSLILDVDGAEQSPADGTTPGDDEWAEIRFGLECGVDWIALSPGPEAVKVRQLRQFLADEKKQHIGILARLQDRPSPAVAEACLQAADGLILKGEFGGPTSSDVAQLPELRRLVRDCANQRKPVVISIPLPESISRPPKSAHVDAGDLSTAVLLEPDGVVFRGEAGGSAQWQQCVRALDSSVREVRGNGPGEAWASSNLDTPGDQMVAAAFEVAGQNQSGAVVILTQEGKAARLAAALRPQPWPVFVFTPNARLARRLRLFYALEPAVIPFSESPSTTMQAAEAFLIKRGFLTLGVPVMFVADPFDERFAAAPAQIRVLEPSAG